MSSSIECFGRDAFCIFLLYNVICEACMMLLDGAKCLSHSGMKLTKADHADLDGIPHYDRSDG